MSIIPDIPPRTELPLRLRSADLGDNVARLTGSTLTLDVNSSAEDQLAAIGDAVQFLLTGRATYGRRVRHLRAVTS